MKTNRERRDFFKKQARRIDEGSLQHYEPNYEKQFESTNEERERLDKQIRELDAMIALVEG
jgi:hypothetical protein